MSYKYFISLSEILKSKSTLSKIDKFRITLNYIASPIWSGLCLYHRIVNIKNVSALLRNDKNIVVENVFFSTSFYELLYQDVKISKLNAWRHFYSWGIEEYRSPQPYLDLFEKSEESTNLNSVELFWNIIEQKKLIKFICSTKKVCRNSKLFIEDLKMTCNSNTHVDYRRSLVHHIFAHKLKDNNCINISEEKFIKINLNNLPKYVLRIISKNLIETEFGWVILNPDKSDDKDTYYCTKESVFFENKFTLINNEIAIVYFTNLENTFNYIKNLTTRRIILLALPTEYEKFKEIIIDEGFELVNPEMIQFRNKMPILNLNINNKKKNLNNCFIYSYESELRELLQKQNDKNILYIIERKDSFSKTEIKLQIGM